MKDIETLEDIQLLVNSFYGKVRQDELLGEIFESVIQDRWSQHLNKMYNFWHTVLLGGRNYDGKPFPPHLRLPVDEQHFNRWVELFSTTVDGLFSGEKAYHAKWQGQRMAEMFQIKIQYFKDYSESSSA